MEQVITDAEVATRKKIKCVTLPSADWTQYYTAMATALTKADAKCRVAYEHVSKHNIVMLAGKNFWQTSSVPLKRIVVKLADGTYKYDFVAVTGISESGENVFLRMLYPCHNGYHFECYKEIEKGDQSALISAYFNTEWPAVNKQYITEEPSSDGGWM
ncbi:protein ORF43 [Anguillid herpesvirus 1]|uniref:Protein ORF43 n=1 Tax=Anguillid herpesvirus 1 TaxID=150286 RepID=A0A1J0REF9_9VIRU|nr:protein ORF43 [Anguillid herpesvirus 1]ADA57806.1 protein ORF43 [Anguillid herpesvirus 1]APD76206.1 ORF43 [Anguillid herpesvirus 1]QRM16336.1 protein ORF43 [Anguillid herpesvirus 1]QRM16466.1 protein ORF43 [Anguillid herpesvirus 1]QRM16595.1 protein ORF43 [Anguillid herpesvirus 1]